MVMGVGGALLRSLLPQLEENRIFGFSDNTTHAFRLRVALQSTTTVIEILLSVSVCQLVARTLHLLGLSEWTVAVLLVAGFMSSGVIASLVGIWQISSTSFCTVHFNYHAYLPCLSHQLRSGRKKFCLVFCMTYVFTCFGITIPYLPILFLGCLAGGISTFILYSALESWLVSAANRLTISSSDLSTIFGRATLVNGFVATGAGVPAVLYLS
ncbi:hypothetical protein V8B97DRAFT_361495 [Scleroderma yunnanense]